MSLSHLLCCLLLLQISANYVLLIAADETDPSWSFRQEKSTSCEQLLNLALDINVNVFEDYSTAIQTAILLTQMPMTVGVSDVSFISLAFLKDIQMQISQQAYLCETEPDDLCKRLDAMTLSWNSDPLALLSEDTRKSLSASKKYSNESIETVVIPFLKKISQRTRFLIKKNCGNMHNQKLVEPLLIS
ncbi:hypothetical protein L596_003425 [Steinernema carpocapsae]|uniref:Uncharacterized protein n=1 Tax=Steinernema carpocapsae TaxID=34508 RepID=A0A4U8USJ6_STECR|nr:hypothetical protein L596_003425 [Steinernema carpocapsae]